MQGLILSRNSLKMKYPLGLADLISKIKKNKEDVYSLLNAYARHLSQSKISTITLNQRIVTIKNFLEYHDIDVSLWNIKLKVKLPRIVRRNKEAISKEDIVEILNAASDIRLKTFVMLLAVYWNARRGNSRQYV